MILQALHHYYQRLADDPETNIPPLGFSEEKIHFALTLSPTGELVQVRDLRQQDGRRMVPKLLAVPQATKRTVAIAPNFMWDNTTYVLGADAKAKPDRARQAHEAFCELHRTVLGDTDDPGLQTLLRFLERWQPEAAAELPDWEEMAGRNLVFMLDGELAYLHDRPEAKRAWQRLNAGADDAVNGMCLITGEDQPVARLHAAIKGVRNAQSSGASLVGFNLGAFCSYGKKQNFNAPVGEEAAFCYTTALNHLLRSDGHRVQIADATTVFWAGQESSFERIFGLVINPGAEDDDTVKEARLFLDAVRLGRWREGIPRDTPFFVLGLAPNAARLSVRFWHQGTVEQISQRLARHFDDLAIVRSGRDSEYPPMWRLLAETALQNKLDNIPPLLAGEVLRSILNGGSYPGSWLSCLIGRIRADQRLNYLRAASLKAILIRNHHKEVTVPLDTTNTDVPYLLGRLFAVLEKAQFDALGKTNTTIRDRYMSAASATPRAVFPQLLRLAQAHIHKAEYGRVNDRRIQEVMEHLKEFPTHLRLEQQGQFFVGYYHQRQDFYKKGEEIAEPGGAEEQSEVAVSN